MGGIAGFVLVCCLLFGAARHFRKQDAQKHDITLRELQTSTSQDTVPNSSTQSGSVESILNVITRDDLHRCDTAESQMEKHDEVDEDDQAS